MKLQDKYKNIIDWFNKNQGTQETELHYKTDFQLLVAVILSAQCTDKRVNLVTPALFEKFPDVFSMAKASAEEVFEFVKSVSYPNNKSKHLANMAKMVVEQFGGKIPSDVDLLQTLPGVGRKTANVMVAVLYNQPRMAVDTHVFRVARRIGLSTGKTPLQVENELVSNIPQKDIPNAHHWLILHGRYVCTARKPKCESCGIAEWCDKKMKYLQIIIMVFALNFGLNAQTYKGEEIIVGVKGGVALSSGSFVEPNNSRPEQNACYHHLGGFGGLAFRYSGEKYLAVQVEANFMQRGWRSYNDFSRTFNYVEIPLLAHAFYGAKGFRWFVNFGPEISFLVNESQWGAADTVYMSEPVKSRFDYGLLVGTGFEIHTKAGIYQLEGRYEFGFGDVFSALPSDTFRRSANRNITLTFGILFNLKKYK